MKSFKSHFNEAKDTHCSDECCGADVKAADCDCPADCPHCNCNAVSEGSIKGSGTDRKAVLKKAYRSGEQDTRQFNTPGGAATNKPKRGSDATVKKAYQAGRDSEQGGSAYKGKRRSKPQDTLGYKKEDYDVNELTVDFINEHNITLEQLENMTEEELNELLGKAIGGAVKMIAKGARNAVVNKQGNIRGTTAAKADSAEAKANKAEKKVRDAERVKAAAERLKKAKQAQIDNANK
jgi:hypothetical protein